MKERFEAVMDLVDDILAADPEPDPEPAASHPHDRTASLRITRRGGSVAPREMHCLCPVHPAPERAWRRHAAGRQSIPSARE